MIHVLGCYPINQHHRHKHHLPLAVNTIVMIAPVKISTLIHVSAIKIALSLTGTTNHDHHNKQQSRLRFCLFGAWKLFQPNGSFHGDESHGRIPSTKSRTSTRITTFRAPWWVQNSSHRKNARTFEMIPL